MILTNVITGILVGLTIYTNSKSADWKVTKLEIASWEDFSKESGMINPHYNHKIGKLFDGSNKFALASVALFQIIVSNLISYLTIGNLPLTISYLTIFGLLIAGSLVDIRYFYMPYWATEIPTILVSVIWVYNHTTQDNSLLIFFLFIKYYILLKFLGWILTRIGSNFVGGADISLFILMLLILLTPHQFNYIQIIYIMSNFLIMMSAFMGLWIFVVKKVQQLENIKKYPFAACHCLSVSIIIFVILIEGGII